MAVDVLRSELLELLAGEGAHMPLDEAVADFPVEAMNARPPNVSYTPWQLLEHVRITQWDILDYIRNRAYLEPELARGLLAGARCDRDRGGVRRHRRRDPADQRRCTTSSPTPPRTCSQRFPARPATRSCGRSVSWPTTPPITSASSRSSGRSWGPGRPSGPRRSSRRPTRRRRRSTRRIRAMASDTAGAGADYFASRRLEGTGMTDRHAALRAALGPVGVWSFALQVHGAVAERAAIAEYEALGYPLDMVPRESREQGSLRPRRDPPRGELSDDRRDRDCQHLRP